MCACVCINVDYPRRKGCETKPFTISTVTEDKKGSFCDARGLKSQTDFERSPSACSAPPPHAVTRSPPRAVLSVLVLPEPRPGPGGAPRRSPHCPAALARSGGPDGSSSRNARTKTWKTRIEILSPRSSSGGNKPESEQKVVTQRKATQSSTFIGTDFNPTS